MLVESLRLNDVKCFPDGTLIELTMGKSSPHKWIVVYGDNGLGKSTLLRVLGMALTGQPALNMLLPSAEGWVREGTTGGLIQVAMQKGPGDKSPGGRRQRAIHVGWSLVGASPEHDGVEVYPAHSIYIVDRHGNELTARSDRTVAKQLDEDVRFFKQYIATDEPKRGWL